MFRSETRGSIRNLVSQKLQVGYLKIEFTIPREDIRSTGANQPSTTHRLHRTFRRGRAIIVVMSRSVGQGMFLHSQIGFARFQMVLLWLALQLKRMFCMVSVELHLGHIPLSLYLSFLTFIPYFPHF